MAQSNTDDWEALCRRCGQCCFEKWITEEGAIRFTRIPCRHLDMISRECRVYAKRLEVGEGCVQLTPGNVQALGWLPRDCAYLMLNGGGPPARRRSSRGRRRGHRA